MNALRRDICSLARTFDSYCLDPEHYSEEFNYFCVDSTGEIDRPLLCTTDQLNSCGNAGNEECADDEPQPPYNSDWDGDLGAYGEGGECHLVEKSLANVTNLSGIEGSMYIAGGFNPEDKDVNFKHRNFRGTIIGKGAISNVPIRKSSGGLHVAYTSFALPIEVLGVQDDKGVKMKFSLSYSAYDPKSRSGSRFTKTLSPQSSLKKSAKEHFNAVTNSEVDQVSYYFSKGFVSFTFNDIVLDNIYNPRDMWYMSYVDPSDPHATLTITWTAPTPIKIVPAKSTLINLGP